MEESLISSGPTLKRKRVNFSSSVLCYLSLIIVLSSVVLGGISLGMCDKSVMEKKLYSYTFPYGSSPIIPDGSPVHLNIAGEPVRGGGISIYLNVTHDPMARNMKNIKARILTKDIVVAFYDDGYTGKAIAYVFGSNVKSGKVIGEANLPETAKQRLRDVSEVVQLTKNRFILVGGQEVLPISVSVTTVGDKYLVDFLFGKAIEFKYNYPFPHVDTMSDELYCMSYENDAGNIEVATMYWDGVGSLATLKIKTFLEVGERFIYHRITGLSETHFVVGASGFRTGDPTMVIAGLLVTVQTDGTLVASKWNYKSNARSTNWIYVDNFDSRNIIFVYIAYESNALMACHLRFDAPTNSLIFGSTVELQGGGATVTSNHIIVRLLSNKVFGVMYEDHILHATCFITGAITPTNDLAITSPTYVISRGERNTLAAYDLTGTVNEFVIADNHYVNQGAGVVTMLHKGEMRPRPIGVVIGQSGTNGVIIKSTGVVTLKGYKDLSPGYAYYTDSRGTITRGIVYGQAFREFGVSYVRVGTSKIISLSSLLGVAVDRDKIMLTGK